MTTEAIEKLAQDTEALEPGDFKPGEYVQRPEGESEDHPDGRPGMMISDLVSAGHVMLYDTRTSEPSVVNRNMRAPQLKARRPDGSLVFTTVKPEKEPWRGSIKCFLHKDGPNREHYDKMGFPVCKKSTLPSQFQADNHAKNRHRDEWAAVEAEREAGEKREDRAANRALLELVRGNGAQAPSEVVDTSSAEAGPPAVVAPISGQCIECDWRSQARTNANRKVSLKQHVERAHS
jgi:hypothetical protein